MTKPASAALATPSPSLFSNSGSLSQDLAEAFLAVRSETERRAALLSPEDQVVQSMPDASPTKWHRAHVTWFFEQFLLKPYVKNYTPFDERFAYLYNSYYVSAGPRAARPQRGLVTRPSAAEVAAYRAHVDAAVADLIETAGDFGQIVPIIEIGLNHEQQHQELLLTDILHAFAHTRRTRLTIQIGNGRSMEGARRCRHRRRCPGLDMIGHDGDGFHSTMRSRPIARSRPVKLSRDLVTNAEWFAFMADGGYTTPTLWLSDGFATVEARDGRHRAIGERLTANGAHDARGAEAGRSLNARSATSAIMKPTRSRAGREASADRNRMGSRRQRRPSQRRIRHRLAMDGHRLFSLSRL